MTVPALCAGSALDFALQHGRTNVLLTHGQDDAGEAGPVEFVPCMDEVELLTAFWDVAKHYEQN